MPTNINKCGDVNSMVTVDLTEVDALVSSNTGTVTWYVDPTLATLLNSCLLYTSDAADERSSVDLGGRRIIKKKKTINQNTQRSMKQQEQNTNTARKESRT